MRGESTAGKATRRWDESVARHTYRHAGPMPRGASDQGVVEKLIRIDLHSAYFRKTRGVKVNMTRMHAPQDANKR